MKQQIHALLQNAIQQLEQQNLIPADQAYEIQVERCKDPSHGDFSSNLAMLLAKPLKKAPRECAQMLINALPTNPLLQQVSIAGPGFINFTVAKQAWHTLLKDILNIGKNFGSEQANSKQQRILVEFVSSNPTGPLHVGHGRSAAFGDVLANLLEADGYQITREYYVNDAGRQMDIITLSVWLRYLEICGEQIEFPSHGYQGEYVREIAEIAKQQFGLQLFRDLDVIFAQLPPSSEEAYVDTLIQKLKKSLGKDYRQLLDLCLSILLEDMRQDLLEFGVKFDVWFSERSLFDSGEVKKTIERLSSLGHTYTAEGALWFRSSNFGDDKDRVLLRENGQATYFAADLAYHVNKLERGANRLINILGADHHGYYNRVQAGLIALGYDTHIEVILIQMVNLYRGDEKLQMSTRGGTFVTFRELRHEVSDEATRFFYLLKRHEQPIDFDLELAKKNSNDNPLYYLQYAHARICSVFRQYQEQGHAWNLNEALKHLALLDSSGELQLLASLNAFPEVRQIASAQSEPYILVQYLRQLAADYHSYYNSTLFLVEDQALALARLALNAGIQQIFRNGFKILGIPAMEKM